MKRTWSSSRDEWLRKTSLANETSLWAIDSLNKNEAEIYDLENISSNSSEEELNERLKVIKKAIKHTIIEKENELDDLSLNGHIQRRYWLITN